MSLRVQGVKRAAGLFEMMSAVNGQATISTVERLPLGQPHIIWQRSVLTRLLRIP